MSNPANRRTPVVHDREYVRITKALSIHQPWLFCILSHYKDIEIRTWNTKFRGYFALHASKTFDTKGYDYLKENTHLQLPLKNLFERGKILGIANLYDVKFFEGYQEFYDYKDRHLNNPSWFDGSQKGFILQDIKMIDPIELKGRLNFFNVDLEVEC